MKIVFLTFVFFFAANLVEAKPLTLKEISESSCRITSLYVEDNQLKCSVGSGTVVNEDKSKYVILTNAHVVRSIGVNCVVDFFKDGIHIESVKGVVYWSYKSNDSIDLGVVLVDKKQMIHKPRVIKVAPRHTFVTNQDYIYGSGFPKGDWLHSWEARVQEVRGNWIRFNMRTIPGQSGSGIMSNVMINGEEHTRLVGVIAWRLCRGGSGVSLNGIYNTIARNKQHG